MSEIEDVMNPKSIEIMLAFYPDSRSLKIETKMKEPTVEAIVFFLNAAIRQLTDPTKTVNTLGEYKDRRFNPSNEYMAELNDNSKEISVLKSKCEKMEEALRRISKYRGRLDDPTFESEIAKEALDSLEVK